MSFELLSKDGIMRHIFISARLKALVINIWIAILALHYLETIVHFVLKTNELSINLKLDDKLFRSFDPKLKFINFS